MNKKELMTCQELSNEYKTCWEELMKIKQTIVDAAGKTAYDRLQKKWPHLAMPRILDEHYNLDQEDWVSWIYKINESINQAKNYMENEMPKEAEGRSKLVNDLTNELMKYSQKSIIEMYIKLLNMDGVDLNEILNVLRK